MESILNQYAEKGLPACFCVTRTGDIAVARDAEATKEQLKQMALVVFETISAIGELKIDTIEVAGASRRLIMRLREDDLVGSLCDRRDGAAPEELWKLLAEIERRPAAAVGERTHELLETGILERMKPILADYLGDFADRIFHNQLESHGIDVTADALSPKDVRRLVATLTKAASMIIGPTKSRDMRNKLLDLLR